MPLSRWVRGCMLAVVATVATVVLACTGGATASAPSSAGATATPGGPASRSTVAPVTGRVTVFAASSLTNVFKEIAASFQKANPGSTVEFNFAASSALAVQLDQGAPADIFASADTANMDRVTSKALIEGTPGIFARNAPVIVVPAENRAGVSSASDLARPGVKLVLAGPDVPIGAYARQIINRLASEPSYGAAYRDATLKNLVSNEANVRAVLTKVELGEADAGIVYRTDAIVSGPKVKVVAIPDAANVVATYPVGLVRAGENKQAASAFLRYLGGPEAQGLLKAAGFDPLP